MLKANILIVRDTFTDKSITGKLYFNDEFVCYTLENPYLDNQRGISSIPTGLYDVRVRPSEESKSLSYVHLQVIEVPARSYILFHIGNKPKDTNGCILTGLTRQENIVLSSVKAHTLLMNLILGNEVDKIELLIKNETNV